MADSMDINRDFFESDTEELWEGKIPEMESRNDESSLTVKHTDIYRNQVYSFSAEGRMIEEERANYPAEGRRIEGERANYPAGRNSTSEEKKSGGGEYRTVGVVGLSPKCGTTFITGILKLLQEGGAFRPFSGEEKPMKIIDLGEIFFPRLEALSLIVVVTDGSTEKEKERDFIRLLKLQRIPCICIRNKMNPGKKECLNDSEKTGYLLNAENWKVNENAMKMNTAGSENAEIHEAAENPKSTRNQDTLKEQQEGVLYWWMPLFQIQRQWDESEDSNERKSGGVFSLEQ